MKCSCGGNSEECTGILSLNTEDNSGNVVVNKQQQSFPLQPLLKKLIQLWQEMVLKLQLAYTCGFEFEVTMQQKLH